MELVQLQEIHEVREGVGDAAGIGCRVDYSCDELGAIGFSATVGMLRCTQLVASWDCGADDDIL